MNLHKFSVGFCAILMSGCLAACGNDAQQNANTKKQEQATLTADSRPFMDIEFDQIARADILSACELFTADIARSLIGAEAKQARTVAGCRYKIPTAKFEATYIGDSYPTKLYSIYTSKASSIEKHLKRITGLNEASSSMESYKNGMLYSFVTEDELYVWYLPPVLVKESEDKKADAYLRFVLHVAPEGDPNEKEAQAVELMKKFVDQQLPT